MKDVTLGHDFTLKMLAALVLQLYTPEVDMQATAVLGRIRPVSSGTVSDRSLVSLSHCFLSHTHRLGFPLERNTRDPQTPGCPFPRKMPVLHLARLQLCSRTSQSPAGWESHTAVHSTLSVLPISSNIRLLISDWYNNILQPSRQAEFATIVIMTSGSLSKK